MLILYYFDDITGLFQIQSINNNMYILPIYCKLDIYILTFQ